MVRVVARQGRVVEVGADAVLAVVQQEPVSLIGCLGGAEAGYLTPGPQPPQVHVGIGAASEGKLPRLTQVPGKVVVSQVVWCIDRIHFQAREAAFGWLLVVGHESIFLAAYPIRTYLSTLFSEVKARYRSPWVSTQDPWAEREENLSRTVPSPSNTLIWGGAVSVGRSDV